jgi:type I restriction enzyme S subunit
MIPTGWRTVRIADIAAPKRWALNGGPFGSKLTTKHYSGSGVPVIRGTNLSGRLRFSHDDFVYVSEQKADELLANNAHPGDLVFTQRGTIGQVGLIPRDSVFPRFVVSQSQMKLTPDESLADPEFLYMLFTAPVTVRRLQDLAFSAGVPHINLDILRQFDIALPPLSIQKRIASLISLYDTLIQNCLNRIQVVEELTRALYREWFVYFRFPGNNGGPLVESPLGLIPEAWEVVPCSALATFMNGFAFKPSHWGKEGLPIVKIKELKAGVTANTPRNPGENIPTKFKVRDGDVLFSWSADLDVYLWREGPGLLNQHLFNVLPFDGYSRGYCYHALRAVMPRFRALSLGATMHHIKRSALDQVTLVLPPHEVRQSFDRIVEPIHDLMIHLSKAIRNLRDTRDLLLPRLMCGRLTLPEAKNAAAATL